MPPNTSTRSRRKKAITATMLPSWITAVTATPGSPQPNTTGTTLRWAVLLIGRNSVSPWTIPSTR